MEPFAAGVGITDTSKRVWTTAQGDTIDLCRGETHGYCQALDSPLEKARVKHGLEKTWIPGQRFAHHTDADTTPMIIATGSGNMELVADERGMSWQVPDVAQAPQEKMIDDTQDITTGIPLSAAKEPVFQGFQGREGFGISEKYHHILVFLLILIIVIVLAIALFSYEKHVEIPAPQIVP